MSAFCDLSEFYLSFNGTKGIIGKSTAGRPIYYFKVQFSCSPVLIVQYSIHAREFITSYLAMEQIKHYYSNGKKGCVYFLPMINPDGVIIAEEQDGLYKANLRGVDLNVNFDARWGTGKFNSTFKGTENYIGKYPFSEKETIALRDFTLGIRPDMTVSYHAKGQEIYYEFFQDKIAKKKDYKIARRVAKSTGYSIKSTKDSAGGYKDWCVEKLKIPAITIEVGSDKLIHPIKKDCLPRIYKENKNVIKVLTEKVKWN